MPGFISHYKFEKWWQEAGSELERAQLERSFDALLATGKGPHFLTGRDLDEFLESDGDAEGEEQIGLTRGNVAYAEPTRAAFLRLLADQTTGELADRLRNHAREIEEGNA